jgi:hypothetical protein
MSKFYIIKDLISLSNYSKKYNVNLKKIYRYIGDEIIEHYLIDDVAYLPDEEIPVLIKNHKRNFLINNVQTLTSKVISVKNLTLKEETIDNEEVNNVQILTLKQKELLETSDVKLNAENLDKKYKIIELINKIKEI